MSGVAIASVVPLVFLGVFLVIGLVAILRARQEDVPKVVRALGSWLWRR
jgi:hypothetical protein